MSSVRVSDESLKDIQKVQKEDGWETVNDAAEALIRMGLSRRSALRKYAAGKGSEKTDKPKAKKGKSKGKDKKPKAKAEKAPKDKKQKAAKTDKPKAKKDKVPKAEAPAAAGEESITI